MKLKTLILPLVFIIIFFCGCSKDDVDPKPPITDKQPEEEVDPVERSLEVETFIYRILEEIYLYEADVPELANDYFSSESAKQEFFLRYDSPEDLFDGLLSKNDRFSFLVNDYVSLEKSFRGTSTTTGLEYALYLFGSNNILAVVNYVLPGTSAAEQGIERGDMFYKVDGVDLTEDNFLEMLSRSTFEIEVAYLNGQTITPTGQIVSLSQEEYNSNPVHIAKVLPIEETKIGYLMYNAFTEKYDRQLNEAFAMLKSEGITDLVLDLRYNGGGDVATAVGLAGMITGQFTGEILLQEIWNELYQSAFEPESYFIKFQDYMTLNRYTDNGENVKLNSLGLEKVYVLTTGRTASASELIINGLEPYIDVVQIGTNTVGKFEASSTFYDSPNGGREDANPNHTYAIQPLIFKTANKLGKTDFWEGLPPDIELEEDIAQMGILGDIDEPLLNAAIRDILGEPQKPAQLQKTYQRNLKFKYFGESGMDSPIFQKMYINKSLEFKTD